MYLFRRRKGTGALMHIYVWEHIVSLYITTEPFDGCLRNWVGMQYSWPHTSDAVLCLGQIRQRADPGQGEKMSQWVSLKNLLQAGRQQQQTECKATV